MFSFNVLTNLKKRISRERKLHQILSLTKMSRIVPISVLVDVPPDDLCPLKLRNYRYLYFSHFQLLDWLVLPLLPGQKKKLRDQNCWRVMSRADPSDTLLTGMFIFTLLLIISFLATILSWN